MFRIDYPFKKEILACGAQQQAGFCLTKKNCGYVVNDLGSLDELAAFERYQHEIEHFREELKVTPKVIAHDLYPEYNSTKYAQGLSRKIKSLKYFPVQHHHAHLASCIGENKLETKILGVVFDASGFGEDGNVWGGEFFVGNLQGFKRVAHLKYVPISNNLTRIQNGQQLAASYLFEAFGDDFIDLEIEFLRRQQKEDWQVIRDAFLKAPSYSSSAAGLFDAVSALVGLREKTEYEGQGIFELERIVNRSSHVANKLYEFTIKMQQDEFLIHLGPFFRNITEDLKRNISKSIISAGVHNTIAEIVNQVCEKIKQQQKVKDVILTGSVFQNKVLFNRLANSLSQNGFRLITHRHFSCNDSNVSFGQAILANAK